MKKLIIYFIFFFMILQTKTYAETNLDSLVDLNEKHWSYNSVIKSIYKYKCMNGFPDHTFRGDYSIKRYELASIILSLIKQIEVSKNISLETQPKFRVNQLNKVNLFYSDVPISHWSFKNIFELNYKYRLRFFSYNTDKFDGDRYVNRYELAFIIDKIIFLIDNKVLSYKTNSFTKKDINKYSLECPNFDNSCKYNLTKKSVDNVTQIYKIMSGSTKNSFKGQDNISRYQLAVTLVKTIEYIEKKYRNNIIFKDS